MPEIQFEGQTKAKLGSVEARGAVESVFGDAFSIRSSKRILMMLKESSIKW
jgi:DNA gyrase/topoisomerase IV subunit B